MRVYKSFTWPYSICTSVELSNEPCPTFAQVVGESGNAGRNRKESGRSSRAVVEDHAHLVAFTLAECEPADRRSYREGHDHSQGPCPSGNMRREPEGFLIEIERTHQAGISQRIPLPKWRPNDLGRKARARKSAR